MNITVIGCGHGGQALAAQLSMSGHRVTIYADENHPGYLDNIANNTITIEGKISGAAIIHCMTKSIEAALRDAETIYMSLPTNAHISQFKKMVPYLKSGQIVLILAGNFSSIYFYQILKEAGKEKDVYLADLASLPYACRAIEAGRINIIDIKKSMDIASIPSKNIGFIIDRIRDSFPTKLTERSNIIELGLNITSAISHPTVMLLNAGRIGHGEEEFYFYREGITHEISHVIEAVDCDRRIISLEYGFELPSYLETMESFYSIKYNSYYDFFTQSPIHNRLKLCPRSMNERYISQDVPYVINQWHGLGLHVGYDSGVMRSIIELSSLLNKENYYKKRSLSVDFFGGMNKSDIESFLFNGYV